MNTALIQLNAGPDKQDNLRRAKLMTQEALAKGAAFVLLPEIFNWRGDTRDKAQVVQCAEAIGGPSTALFIEMAKESKAYILLGSILERIKNQNKAYNTSVLINPDGTIGAKYRKINLFDARLGDKIIRESECFVPGAKCMAAPVGEFHAGLSICYDLRFGDMYRKYAQDGANILTVPSSFTYKTGEAHWEVLLRARAIENLAYVLAPNQVGSDARGIATYGNSMIVSPWGEIIARGSSDREEIVYGKIGMAEIVKARSILPGIIKNARD